MTPLMSSWLKSMEADDDKVTLILASGKKIQYTGVPNSVIQALQTANSPGSIWRQLMRGKYGERLL